MDDIRMSSRFRATLIGDPNYDPAVRMSLLAKISDVQRAMSTGNRSLEFTTHPASSAVVHVAGHEASDRPLGESAPDAGWRETIILLGNPVIWWGCLVVVAVTAVSVLRNRTRWRDHTFAIAFLGGGLLINFVPFIAIRRVMYLYHYLFALMWLILLASYCLGVLADWNARRRRAVAISVAPIGGGLLDRRRVDPRRVPLLLAVHVRVEPRAKPRTTRASGCCIQGCEPSGYVSHPIASDYAETDEERRADAAKEARLTEWLRAQGAIAIGYSGGVDSAYLAAVAVATLGAERVLAIIGRSASYPDSQWATARDGRGRRSA